MVLVAFKKMGALAPISNFEDKPIPYTRSDINH